MLIPHTNASVLTSHRSAVRSFPIRCLIVFSSEPLWKHLNKHRRHLCGALWVTDVQASHKHTARQIRTPGPVGSTLLTSYVLHFNCGYATQTNLKIPCVICSLSPSSFVILLTGLKTAEPGILFMIVLWWARKTNKRVKLCKSNLCIIYINI